MSLAVSLEALNDLGVALPIQARNRGRDGDLHGFSSHGLASTCMDSSDQNSSI